MSEVIKVYSTKDYALDNGSDGRIDPNEAISGHEGIISNSEGAALPYYIYNKYYYRIEANEPVSEFHIDWDEGEDNSPEKANIEIIKLDAPAFSTVVEHIFTEHKHFFPLIRVKSVDGFLSKWYTNDSSLNDYKALEEKTLSEGQNEFSIVSEEKGDSDRINSFLPSNLPPIGVLKADKKRIYGGIDNDAILSTYAYPLLYAYSTSTASTKPNVVFTLQDDDIKTRAAGKTGGGAIKKHTLAGTRIWNAGSVWSSDETTGDTYLKAIPTGNYNQNPSPEEWRLTVFEEIETDGGAASPANVYWHDGSGTGTGTDRYIDWFYNGSTDKYGNSKLRMFFYASGGSKDLTGKLPDTNLGPSGYSTCQIQPTLSSGEIQSDSILNDILIFFVAQHDAPNMEIPLTIQGGSVTTDGDDHYMDIVHDALGCTDTWVIGAGLQQTVSSNPMFTFTIQNDGCPITTKTEYAKKLLRVELTNAKNLADTDRVYIKVFDALTTIMGDALVTDNTLAVLSNGNPIVDLSNESIVYLDGTESRTRASNRDISLYNFDDDKLYKVGAVQAADIDSVSDLISGTFSSTGSKELSYSFSNIGDTLDSDSRFYSTYRLPRLQVKDDFTSYIDNVNGTYDTLTYSAIEHFAPSTYTAAGVYMPSNLESRGLLMYSNHNTVNTANWHDVSTRNLNDTQEIMGSASTGAEGTYVLNGSSNLTDHPKSHLLMVQTDKFDRVYFRMNNNNAAGGAMPDVAITAYYANGTTWTPLEIIDETQGLKTSGSIKFTTPYDWYKGNYSHIDDGGDWLGPVPAEDSGVDVSNLWTVANFPDGAYGLLISFTVKSTSTNHRNLKCMNAWPYNNPHSQLIEIVDSHHVSLNNIAIAQSISFGRDSKTVAIEDKFGKTDIRKMGASGGQVTFGGIDFGKASNDERKIMVGYQKNATPVFLDVSHRSGDITRFFGVVTRLTEDHPAGKMFQKWAVTMQISHILELGSDGLINSDKISIGGALVDDGKYLL